MYRSIYVCVCVLCYSHSPQILPGRATVDVSVLRARDVVDDVLAAGAGVVQHSLAQPSAPKKKKLFKLLPLYGKVQVLYILLSTAIGINISIDNFCRGP